MADRKPLKDWSGLVIVGETPGAEEVRRGAVFCGASGRLLERIARGANVDLERCYITNAIACPPLAGIKASEEDEEKARRCCEERLDVLLNRLNPRAAIALGAMAWKSLTGLSGVIKYLGTTAVPETTGRDYPCVCTLHPAAMLRQEGYRPMIDMVLAHLNRAWRYARGELQVWEMSVDPAQFEPVKAFLAATLADLAIPVALDIETCKGPKGHSAKDIFGCEILCLGVATPDKGWCLPLGKLYDGYYSEPERAELMGLVRQLLDQPGRPIVFQNAQFDLPVLQRLWFPGPWGCQVHDTLLQHHVLFPKCPHDLQAIASHFFPIEPWKAYYSGDWSGQIDLANGANLQYYNALDVLMTARAFVRMQHLLSASKLAHVYEADRALNLLAMEWRRHGVLVSTEVRKELARDEQRNIMQMLVELRDMAKNPSFNPSSPSQVRGVLSRQFGIVPTSVTQGGKISTNSKSLFQYKNHPFVELLFRYRESTKLYGTYLEGVGADVGDDSRLHSEYSISATPTGRFGTKPAIQNWPKSMRKMLVAPPGKLIVSCDFKALELRIIALLSGEDELIERFMADEDIHAWNAEHVYFREVWGSADAAKRKDLRKLGKTITFGDNYLATAPTLFENIREENPGITLEQVAKLQARLRNKYHRKIEWAEAMRQEAERTGELRTPWLGRRRMWPLGEVPATEAANFPIQGGAADIVGERTLMWLAILEERGDYRTRVFPHCQIHDALYAEVDEDYAEQAALWLIASLECTKTHRCVLDGKEREMRFSVDASIGPNFYDLQERPDLKGAGS